MPYIDGTGKNYSQKKQRVDQWRTQRSTSFTCTCILTYCKYCSPLPLYVILVSIVNRSSVLSRMFCSQPLSDIQSKIALHLWRGPPKSQGQKSRVCPTSPNKVAWHLIGPHPSGCMSNQTWALQQAHFFVVVTLLLSSCFSGSRQFNDMKNAHRLIVFTCLHCHSRHGASGLARWKPNGSWTWQFVTWHEKHSSWPSPR